MMRDILVTGGSGQVGGALARHRWPDGWRVVAPSREQLDLRNPCAIAAAVASARWAAVVNAAAFTHVDRAEDDVALTWTINALAPAAFATACRSENIPLIQISTDYVFDGAKPGAWDEEDRVGPVGVYGASKLGGELAVRTAHKRHAVVRTSWVASPYGHNFLKSILRAGEGRSRLNVVADQSGSPTSAADLASALAVVTVRMATDDCAPTGVFHFANTGPTTWAEFAQAIAEGAKLRGGPIFEINPVTTAEYPTLAKRPSNSLLSTRRIESEYGVVPRPWREALEAILDELIGPA